MMEHITQNEESSQKAASSVSASPGGIHKQPLPLDDIRALVEACHRCDLCEGRTQVVFGAGNPHADVLIVGEAPGKNEDLQGEPFVGAAGKFLNELLDSANLKREDVFIANVIKCRPPGNRNPRADEIEACADFLREQTRTINPKVIVTLGNFATQFIMKTGIGITHLHGTIHQVGRFTVMPVYHPAAAIYDRAKRDVLFEDFAQVGRVVREMNAQAC